MDKKHVSVDIRTNIRIVQVLTVVPLNKIEHILLNNRTYKYIAFFSTIRPILRKLNLKSRRLPSPPPAWFPLSHGLFDRLFPADIHYLQPLILYDVTTFYMNHDNISRHPSSSNLASALFNPTFWNETTALQKMDSIHETVVIILTDDSLK